MLPPGDPTAFQEYLASSAVGSSAYSRKRLFDPTGLRV
jgi:hypothetical protein